MLLVLKGLVPECMGLFDLSGRAALITGASRGLGLTFARALARAGADVAITSRTRDSLADSVAEMESLGRRAVPLELDVREEGSIRSAVEAAHAALGKIDILVNNAGCNIRKPAADVTWEDWNTILDTNLRGPFFVAQAAARYMVPRRYGRIINIGSEVLEKGVPEFSNYVSAKGAQLGLTRSWAMELAKHGITVNLVAPGWIPTERHAGDSQESKDAYAKAVPVGHMGEDEDVANAVAFLASDDAKFITGQKLSVNGGNTLE
jgi:gluconate 5-dehydrogenase